MRRTEQQARLAAIASAATRDLLPLREKAVAARRQALALLTATTIDRAAMEQVRAEQMQLAEAATKRVAQALADAGEALSADQRAEARRPVARRAVGPLEMRRGRAHPAD